MLSYPPSPSRTVGHGAAWLRCASLLALGLATVPATALAAEGEPADATDRSGSAAGDDIIVTARFKAENVRKVPVPITVLRGQALEETHLQTLDQFQRLAPSLQIQGINPRNQTIAIRGLGTNPGLTTEGFESGVGVYVDGVYNARSAITLFDIFDIDRVEVLRGPQGTLFGKNTTAGAIAIVSKAPEFDFGGSVQGTYGNYGLRQIQATITGPITDNLAARVTLG
ncbi:MAG: TonB-dependent receptor plug domain-containing protein, partial [Burkholderiaceae bacterium]